MIVELVNLTSGVGERDSLADCVPQVDLTVDVVEPSGRVGVYQINEKNVRCAFPYRLVARRQTRQEPSERTFEISHESLCTGVKSIDDHFTLNGSSNLHPPVF